MRLEPKYELYRDSHSVKYKIKHFISKVSDQDIGNYSCVVNTGVETTFVQYYNFYPSIKSLSNTINHVYSNDSKNDISLSCPVKVM